MLEERIPIEGFQRYEVSNFGNVYNRNTGRKMHLSPTLAGTLTVGLMLGDRQYRRSVKVLVARAFVPGETEIFNTPIHLDGDIMNLRATNLVWRPRWFAWYYTHQFQNIHDWFHSGPVFNTTTGHEYNSILDAAIHNGCLCKDIRLSILNETRVFPFGDHYVYSNTLRRR